MNALDLAAIAGAALLTTAFAAARFGELIFVAGSAVVVAGGVLLALVTPAPPAQAVLLAVGLALYAFGLAIVRVMLHRSVSLRMLARLGEPAAEEGSRLDIRGRLDDIARYRLARSRGGSFELTAFGRLVARIVAWFYQVTQVGA